MVRCKDCDVCGFNRPVKFYRRYGCFLCKNCKDKREDKKEDE